MKKIFIATFAFTATALSFTACSTMSHTVDKVNLNGTYTVSNVQVEGVNLPPSSTHTETVGNVSATILTQIKLNTTVFDDVTPNCFIGSQWVLPHNGYGTYTIQNNGDCYAGVRNIVWSVRSDANGGKKFQMKIVNGQKARKVSEGYILDIYNATPQGFTLVSPVTVDGQTGYVYYDFTRQ